MRGCQDFSRMPQMLWEAQDTGKVPFRKPTLSLWVLIWWPSTSCKCTFFWSSGNTLLPHLFSPKKDRGWGRVQHISLWSFFSCFFFCDLLTNVLLQICDLLGGKVPPCKLCPKVLELDKGNTLPKTKSSPPNIGLPKRKESSSNRAFEGNVSIRILCNNMQGQYILPSLTIAHSTVDRSTTSPWKKALQVVFLYSCSFKQGDFTGLTTILNFHSWMIFPIAGNDSVDSESLFWRPVVCPWTFIGFGRSNRAYFGSFGWSRFKKWK